MFAGYPAPYVYDEPGGKRVQQLVWGDWVGVGDEVRDGFREVTRARNASGWMREADLVEERLLEVNFVDVGQGDGCFIVTPEDKFLVIDAGQDDNMFWYLRWRFNLRHHPQRRIPIEHAVITHPDIDHYGGFRAILDSPQLSIGTLHHNGIVERTGKARFGPEVKVGRARFLSDVVVSKAQLAKLVKDDATVGRMPYPAMLRQAVRSKRVKDVRMLSARDRHLPGYEAGDLRIEVLGPVTDTVDRKRMLRRLGDDGVTKNGHSVSLMLRYRDVSIALGGDLNREAQHHLLASHCDVDADAVERGGEASRAAACARAREVFEADVAKACHHGSGDIDDLFLEATNPLATIISSGDNESYAHPRPDALGAIGRFGRGSRPLIFSTELARSVSVLDRPERIRKVAGPLIDDEREVVHGTGASREEEPGRVVAQFQRAIAVYGLITLRTDGDRVLLAQKLEKASGSREFDYHCLDRTSGALAYNPDI